MVPAIIGNIIEIVIGFVIWKIVPGWITEGGKSVRNVIKLICNILGVIIVLHGCYALLMNFF